MQLNSNEIVDNINSIKSMSIQTQGFIHEVCAKITDSMKLYDLKLKEIEVLDKQIEKERLQVKKPMPLTKEQILERRDSVLHKKLIKDKKKVSQTVRAVAGQHNKLINVVKLYNKKFVEKHRGNLKDLLTQITLQLKGHMSNPHFKKAYKQFMTLLLKKVQTMSADALKDPEKTARVFIADNWKRILDEITNKTEQKRLEKKYPVKKQ